MNFDKLLRKRKTIKKYSSRKIQLENLIEAIEAANLAPTPGNLAILKYIIVEEQEIKDKIAESCRQEFLRDVSFIVVVCSDQKKVNLMYDKRADRYTKQQDRKSTRLNSSHIPLSRMPSSA